MKRKLLIPLLSLCLAVSAVCMGCSSASGGHYATSEGESNPSNTLQTDETGENVDAKVSAATEEPAEVPEKTGVDPQIATEGQIASEDLDEVVSADVDSTISAIKAKHEKLVKDVDSYKKYSKNVDEIKLFYQQVCDDTRSLCIRLREYGADYAERLVTSNKSAKEQYKEADELYDCIYNDAGDEIYDETYNGVLDDIYDDFYNGILDDAYDNVPYDEWSDARSAEYDWWSDARSDVYDDWSDFRSDIYDFWSDVRGELYDGDIERAKEKVVDFREDIEKMKS